MEPIAQEAYERFEADAAAVPTMGLRAGAAVDGYAEPPAFDAIADEPTDDYLESYAFNGLTYLDAASWRHYRPRLIEYALSHPAAPQGMVTEALLWSLRPPDRTPPRLASLTADQEDVVAHLLERLALSDEDIPEKDLALQVMSEWWVPGALYRLDGGERE